ncbi:MAG: S9 family peptidase [Cyclobacteriaceae bacterium]|nr:S9 family peptidase [Cyclobacteriaceae bacterium]
MKKSILILSLLLIAATAFSQQKPLTIKDYAKWSRVVDPVISNDGKWFAYSHRVNGGNDTLIIKNLESDKIYKVKFAASPAFSENSKWVSFVIKPSREEDKKLKKDKKPVLNSAGILNLETGKKSVIDRMDAAAFSNNSAVYAVLRKKPSDDNSKHEGKDLILKKLDDGSLVNIGNVGSFVFNQKGNLLAYTVDADKMSGNGLYLYNTGTGEMKTLDTDSATYSQLAWDDATALRSEWANKGKHLAILKGVSRDTTMYRDNSLLVFMNVLTPAYRKQIFPSSSLIGLPKRNIVSENFKPAFSNDGSLVFIGVRAQEKKIKMSKDTLANLDVWHWKDEQIQSVQMKRSEQNKKYTYLCSVNPSTGIFSRLSDETLRDVNLSKNSTYAVGRNDKPYIDDVNWGVSPADLYRVTLKDGKRELFAKLVNRPLGYSPDGKYYLFQLDSSLHVVDLSTNKVTNISKAAPVRFMNMEHPYPHEKPPFGVAGWTKDGKSVVVNHKYDLWMLSLDGTKASNLTAGVGTKEEIHFNYVPMDPMEPFIDTKKPILLSADGEWTKKSGFYSVIAGQEPKVVLYEDRNYGPPRKALNADKVFYNVQTFVDFPDYYVSNSGFMNAKKVTNANPQQKNYAWGKRVLIDYTNSKGQKLQGTLTLPANYEAGKKYPMIVYFYEKMSQEHNSYSMPTYDDRPHMSLYSSNGYLVFQPDNVYDEGRPGTSALDCITSATKKVIDLGYADPKKIGLQGHSWGGYQSSFILTQTDMFACVVTGAPPTNLESFYNNIYGSTGTNHHGIMEIGQVRMGKNMTPWSAREAYQRESPMVHAPKIKTPFMILHGTADGAVDWNQGLEYYNAARRLNKQVIFLSYPNEGHHLAIEANQKDFLVRMQQYFDYYLKGTPAPAWMLEGVANIDKKYDRGE